MDPPRREDFFYSLKRGLMFECGYQFLTNAGTGEVLGVQLSQEVYSGDDLTKAELYRMIRSVFLGYCLIGLELSRFFPPPFEVSK